MYTQTHTLPCISMCMHTHMYTPPPRHVTCVGAGHVPTSRTSTTPPLATGETRPRRAGAEVEAEVRSGSAAPRCRPARSLPPRGLDIHRHHNPPSLSGRDGPAFLGARAARPCSPMPAGHTAPGPAPPPAGSAGRPALSAARRETAALLRGRAEAGRSGAGSGTRSGAGAGARPRCYLLIFCAKARRSAMAAAGLGAAAVMLRRGAQPHGPAPARPRLPSGSSQRYGGGGGGSRVIVPGSGSGRAGAERGGTGRARPRSAPVLCEK